MLPRCDTFKEILFVPRIIAFNETFVPVGKSTIKPYAFVWHEGISGRSKQDITSTFYGFFLECRDIQHIVIWLDNCSAQNKNWTLFSLFIYMMNNCTLVNIETLEVKYFEPGHTFMSADSFHHQVELSLKRKKRVYDFKDFLNCVQNSNSKKVNLIEMQLQDFYEWKDLTSQYKLSKINPRPYLHNMVHLLFETRGKTVKYKNYFDEEFIELDFLLSKYVKTDLILSSQKQKLKGITKKESITSCQSWYQFCLKID